MSDKASSIFQGAQAVGCIIGPIVGGFLNDHFKFQNTCDLMALTCLAYAGVLAYFFVSSKKATRPVDKKRMSPMVSTSKGGKKEDMESAVELSVLIK